MSWRSSGKHNCGSKAGAAAGEERFGKPGAETASGNQNRAQCLCGKYPGDGDGLPREAVQSPSLQVFKTRCGKSHILL